MPAVSVRTNVEYTKEQKTKLLKSVTDIMVEVAHKNEEAVMVMLETVDGTMGNSDEPWCFIDIRSMNGIEHRMNNDVSEAITKVTEEVLGVSGLRTYITFLRIPETCWGLLGGICTWDAATRLWVVNGEPVK